MQAEQKDFLERSNYNSLSVKQIETVKGTCIVWQESTLEIAMEFSQGAGYKFQDNHQKARRTSQLWLETVKGGNEMIKKKKQTVKNEEERKEHGIDKTNIRGQQILLQSFKQLY